jgi:hypothetical protein
MASLVIGNWYLIVLSYMYGRGQVERSDG